MLDYMLLVIGLVGFGLAGYWDLRYTEFPDWLPYSMIIITIGLRAIFSFIYSDLSYIISSLIFGSLFLFVGLFFYYVKQWGDGDAWLLGALGFLMPQQFEFGVKTFFPFPAVLILNFLFVSIIYLVFYSFAIGIKNKRINHLYFQYIKKEKTRLLLWVAFFFCFSWSFAFITYFYMGSENILPMLFLPFFLTFILLFSYYAKIVENKLFKRRIKVSQLKEGDVLLNGKWKGVDKKEIAQIKKKHKYVWIKEGVRFAPVFFLTMITSIFLGDFIFIFI